MSTSAIPSTLFGGSWQQIKDAFLFAASDTYAAGSGAGGNQPHNNMPPYLVVYAWRRTA